MKLEVRYAWSQFIFQFSNAKILYTVVELALLGLAFWLDRRIGLFPLLGLVIVIRSCLIFQQLG